MLYADKQALETELKVSLLAIRERELNLYTSNCRQIGTQAALLFGFAYSGLSVMAGDDYASMPAGYTALFEICSFLSMVLNALALYGATTCAMLGPGLALRGPDGSMDQAVEGLALEYRMTFVLYMAGLLTFYACAILFLAFDINGDYSVYDIVLHLILFMVFLFFVAKTGATCKRIYKKFRLPVGHVVSGAFGGSTEVGSSQEYRELQRLCVRKRWYQWPRRQYLYYTTFMDDFLGISASVFAERYQTGKQKAGRYNRTLHSLIQYLERPSAPSERDHNDRPGSGRRRSRSGSGARRPSFGRANSGLSPSNWFKRGGKEEEKVGLASSVSSNLELSAMRSADHLQSGGAISPSGSSSCSSGASR